MTPARFTLDAELEQAMPRGPRWDRRLVEPAPAEPEPIVTPTVPPALASAIEQAEAAVRDAETCGQYEQARSNLDALRRGERVAGEPAPVPMPPGGGWDVSKNLVRNEKGLIDRIEEHWRPAATGA